MTGSFPICVVWCFHLCWSFCCSCRNKGAFRNILQIITNIVILTFTTKEIRTATCSRDPPSPPYLRRLPLEMCSGPTQTPWQIETINTPIPLDKSTAPPPSPSKNNKKYAPLGTPCKSLLLPEGSYQREGHDLPLSGGVRELCHISSKTVFNLS